MGSQKVLHRKVTKLDLVFVEGGNKEEDPATLEVSDLVAAIYSKQ